MLPRDEQGNYTFRVKLNDITCYPKKHTLEVRNNNGYKYAFHVTLKAAALDFMVKANQFMLENPSTIDSTRRDDVKVRYNKGTVILLDGKPVPMAECGTVLRLRLMKLSGPSKLAVTLPPIKPAVDAWIEFEIPYTKHGH